MSIRQAHQFIKVSEQLPNDSPARQLGLSVLYEIATLPGEERNN